MTSPLVSVVIPCYQQAHFLASAIESVIAQTHSSWEIVVVDDGSRDEAREVAAAYPQARYLRQENRGLAAARNRGFSAVQSEFLVFLDADDRLLPNALEAGLNAFTARPRAALVWGLSEVIDEEGLRTVWVEPDGSRTEFALDYQGDDVYADLLRTCVIWPPAAAMYRREAIEELAGFDEQVSPAADWDMYLRLAQTFELHCHNEFVAQHRRHASNMSNDYATMLEATLNVLDSQHAFAIRDADWLQAWEAGRELVLRYWSGMPTGH